MRCITVEHASLTASNRWTPSFFFGAENSPYAAYDMIELRQLVSEKKGAIDPQKQGERQISYLGLENVRSQTGELVGFEPRAASSIKSRSKIFGLGDILFGRLRPELNKVYLVDGEPSEGICSGEFIVLAPITSRVNARYVRHIIASPFVTKFIEKFRVGASLPRIAADDLLGIKVPVPPLEVQEQIARRLAEMDQELRGLRLRVEELPSQQLEALMMAVGSKYDVPT
ncbi:restriction endonuclease subunit S [Aeromonas caviae]|uniref:restriction endonuclease subunit S n=1 Tax=Aeromonas caviae TaxID=648 RepID=UPI002B48E095|nr:restriction endonuclease subunit S [Aeromonas caviae]